MIILFWNMTMREKCPNKELFLVRKNAASLFINAFQCVLNPLMSYYNINKTP